MTAKEMFEQLGYKYYLHNINVPKSQGIMIPQDEPYIEYSMQENTLQQTRSETLRFRMYAKCVDCEATINNSRFPAPLNADELKAITQQMKELGWWE